MDATLHATYNPASLRLSWMVFLLSHAPDGVGEQASIQK